MPSIFKKLTPNLLVANVERSLAFYEDVLGFGRGFSVPEQSPFAADPERYFVRANVRMLAAEQILDAVSSATGVAEKFKGYPAGTRAIALPEGGLNHPFLTAFSKPVRDVICECAREEDPALPQVPRHRVRHSFLRRP